MSKNLKQRLKNMSEAWHGENDESLESVLLRAANIGAELEREACAEAIEEQMLTGSPDLFGELCVEIIRARSK